MTRLATILAACLLLSGSVVVRAQMPPPNTAWLTDWRVSNQVAVTVPTTKVVTWQVDFGYWDAPRWYVIYTSRDLIHWTPIACGIVPDNGIVYLVVDAADPQRFFRVEQMTDL